MVADPFRQAQASYEAGNLRRSRELALQAFEQHPDDPRLLPLAGRCSLELGLDDAGIYLSKAVALSPDNGDAWHDLGSFLLGTGDTAAAASAFREVVRLQPDDLAARVDLGHALYALGQTGEAISILSQAVQLRPTDLGAMRSLVEMYRGAGQEQAALRTALSLADQQPDDLLAALDVADLSLAVNRLDEAATAYHRLRRLDLEPGHEVFAYHGLIEAEIRRSEWRHALDIALDVAAIDRYDVTTQLLAFIASLVFGRSEQPAPAWADLEQALREERAEHRRFHMGSRVDS